MTGTSIVESGLEFGPFPEEDCWYVEKSACYRRMQKVKIAEFLIVEHKDAPIVWTVEAKTGSPRPETVSFDEFIADICAKLTNAMMLTVAACLGRHPDCAADLPTSLRNLDLARADFRLVLVVKGDPNPWPDDWLPPIRDALNSSLKPLASTWRLAPTAVMVFNESLARKYGLIRSPASASSV